MAASAFAAMLGACSSIDCPLNSRVMTTCKFDQVFNDTLTVSVKRSDGNDSVLMNRLYDADSLAIPMSYNHDSDMLYFDFIDKDTKKQSDGFSRDYRRQAHVTQGRIGKDKQQLCYIRHTESTPHHQS